MDDFHPFSKLIFKEIKHLNILIETIGNEMSIHYQVAKIR